MVYYVKTQSPLSKIWLCKVLLGHIPFRRLQYQIVYTNGYSIHFQYHLWLCLWFLIHLYPQLHVNYFIIICMDKTWFILMMIKLSLSVLLVVCIMIMIVPIVYLYISFALYMKWEVSHTWYIRPSYFIQLNWSFLWWINIWSEEGILETPIAHNNNKCCSYHHSFL